MQSQKVSPMRFCLAATLLMSSCFVSPAMAHEPHHSFSNPGTFAGNIYADAPDAAALGQRCDQYIHEIESRFTALEQQTGRATVTSTLKPFDELIAVINAGGGEFYSFSQSMDTAEKRAAGFECYRRISEIETRIGLSRPVYERLAAIDASDQDSVTQYFLSEVLAGFERSGVALNDEDGARFRQLQEELTALSSEFSSNYANARGVIKALPRELAGMPQDWIEAHPPGVDGMVEISTDAPDFFPVMQYAEDDNLRERIARAYYSLAYPENSTILGQIFTKRDELARLLGRPDYAALLLENRMLRTPEQVEAHMEELAKAASNAAERDKTFLQAALDEKRPGTQLNVFNSAWAKQQVLKDKFDLDPQEVRQYFAYDNVRNGIFELSQDLFQIEIRKWDTPLWHPDVEAFEVYENGALLGAFYLDAHPREGKYQHANHITLRSGVASESKPVSVLTMNLPKGGYDTGLMEHSDVETFLHEFGHLLHNILGGEKRWYGVAGVTTERDFVEAPSQMLENWVYDYDTLIRFARNEAGVTIPRDLVERMIAARNFGRGVFELSQLGNSNASLRFHQGAPADPSASAISEAFKDYHAVYDPYGRRPEGTHQEATFSHLDGYSAGYYTYGWSRVIAADLFSLFERAGLRDRETARAYRTLVLGAGGSKPAAELIEDFLGRPVNADAFKKSIELE
ncbi:M3 family metallopeptidase [Altererythrobacter sp. GH1-8]|uniref:M3 family metallopeptidase n=1 Tax=Altererythrobacter sp. GH1-8 TaxID=3349333 RepID=UPI00374D4354